jgi:hypothetical protein
MATIRRETPSISTRRSGTDTPRRTRRKPANTWGASGNKGSRRASPTPPVVVRGVWQERDRLPVTRTRTRGKPRRRYDISLNVPGAEVRLPSLPSIQFGWRGASGLLFLMMLVAAYFLYFSPFFQVEVIEVVGLQRLTLADLTPVLGVVGDTIAAVDPASVVTRLETAFPELESVKVSVSLPAGVKLILVERQPVIAWVQEDQEQWVDVHGISFLPRGEPGELLRVFASDVFAAHVDDEQPKVFIPPEMVKLILQMSAYIPEDAPMVYDTDHGFGWQTNVWRVYFGKELIDIDLKLKVYLALVDQLKQQGKEPGLISVEYLHGPFYRMER